MVDAQNSLLSFPRPEDEEFVKETSREGCRYENLSERFRTPPRQKYGLQYSHIYFIRLTKMKPILVDVAKQRWGERCRLREMKDLKIGERCCIVGTLFKKMDLQPSILKEISEVHHLLPQPTRVKYTSINDELVLEDFVQRVMLTGDIPTHQLVTGIVVAVLGTQMDNGKFEVEDHCVAGLPPQPSQPPLLTTNALEADVEEQHRCVLLMSGLNLGSLWTSQLSIQMMADYITGQLGGPKDQEYCSHIVRIIIAGNSITNRPEKTNSLKEQSKKVKYLSRNYTATSLEAMRELDDFLCQITSCAPVDLMPGSHDPTNYQLPQQPLHRCMFPQASKNSTLHGVTNPYQAKISNIVFLGTSGENLEDMFRCSEKMARIDLLESSLTWSHTSPTSPDTLACHPYSKQDPFIISECPHVYFAGNQPSFRWKKISGESGQQVLLLCVPSFDLTQSCALVDLDTLQCREISFGVTSLAVKHNPDLDRLGLLDFAADDEDQLGKVTEEERSVTMMQDLDDSDEDMDM